MTMNMPLLSLVVLGYKNFDATTQPCLQSLLPWVNDPEVETIVVDNASPDDSGAKTAQWCQSQPAVQCLLSETNRGFAAGMNWGVSHARGRWVLLVNNDTVFPAHTLDALKVVLKALPQDVAMVGPVTNAAGNGQRLWKPGTSQQEWLDIGAWLNQHPTGHLMPAYRCDFFCIAVRRDVWDKLNGLDPIFGLGYYEDFDFSLRLRKAGLRQVITEDVFIVHTGSATFQGNAAARTLMKSNKKLLQAKHPEARFEHTRLGNLTVMQAYQTLKQEGKWTPALEARLQLRHGALRGDVPRSLFKSWLWSRKIKALL
jgi:GT2 family glycosyltransferase